MFIFKGRQKEGIKKKKPNLRSFSLVVMWGVDK